MSTQGFTLYSEFHIIFDSYDQDSDAHLNVIEFGQVGAGQMRNSATWVSACAFSRQVACAPPLSAADSMTATAYTLLPRGSSTS